MQAQTTLINFTVTRDGLEDQLLAEVVKAERPDLEELKAELTKQQNDFKIMLKKLEDDLLSRLSSAGGNILGDTALVENLETTKRTAAEIEEKVSEREARLRRGTERLSSDFRSQKRRSLRKRSMWHANTTGQRQLELVCSTSSSTSSTQSIQSINSL